MKKIDIFSCNIRYDRYVLGINIYTNIEPTEQSKLIDPILNKPKWKIVSDQRGILNSVRLNCEYGEIYAQLQTLDRLWSSDKFSNLEKIEQVKHLVDLWDTATWKKDSWQYFEKINKTTNKEKAKEKRQKCQSYNL